MQIVVCDINIEPEGHIDGNKIAISFTTAEKKYVEIMEARSEAIFCLIYATLLLFHCPQYSDDDRIIF